MKSHSPSHDLALQLLIDQINHTAACKQLWLADEHLNSQQLKMFTSNKAITIISNRFDVAQYATQFQITARFNDFTITQADYANYDQVYLRLPKEKALYQWLICYAYMVLAEGGELFLSGAKQQGIRSAIKFAQDIFDSPHQRLMHKNSNQLLSFKKLTTQNHQRCELISKQYHSSAPLHNDSALKISTKAGQYGWRKIDLASQLLVEQLEAIYQSFAHPPQSLLDLGCGYGYLVLHTKRFNLQQRTAVDNNAAALLSCRQNCEANELICDVIASDAGSELNSSFDWILCNPPFHSGFFNDSQLLTKFLENTYRLMHNHSKACFVCNEFIPLQQQASKLFKCIELIQHRAGFKLYLLER